MMSGLEMKQSYSQNLGVHTGITFILTGILPGAVAAMLILWMSSLVLMLLSSSQWI